MKHPDTGRPLVVDNIALLKHYGGYMSAGSNMYIEPDVSGKTVVDSWLVFNIKPKGAGEISGEFNSDSNARGTSSVSVEFTNIVVRNDIVTQYAQALLDNMNNVKLVPGSEIVPPYSEPSGDVAKLDKATTDSMLTKKE